MQISGIQTNVHFGDKQANLQTMQRFVESETVQGSRLIVFPECFLTGYCYESLEEGRAMAESATGPSVNFAIDLCRQNDCFIVFGMLEVDGDDVFNTAVLTGPTGLVGTYRKIHLPYLGIDRFVTPGNRPFEVFTADDIRIGMLICYDGGFPEATRALSLQGADVVLLPTNWPPGAEYMSEFSVNARAMENGIYFAAVNRIGRERGFSFIGRSRICDPVGATLDSADHVNEAVIRGTVDVNQARQKRIIRVPGKHVIDRFADRRPEMYGALCEPHDLPRPGRDEPAE